MNIKNAFNQKPSLGALGLAMAGLTACSSAMTRKDCQTTNYYDLGYSDGKNGKTADRLQQLTDECNGLGVEAAAPQYGYGRQAGLAKYCSDANARKDAISGKSDSICWHEPFPTYQVAYREALDKRESDKQDNIRDAQASKAKAQREDEKLSGELQQIEDQKAVH